MPPAGRVVTPAVAPLVGVVVAGSSASPEAQAVVAMTSRTARRIFIAPNVRHDLTSSISGQRVLSISPLGSPILIRFRKAPRGADSTEETG